MDLPLRLPDERPSFDGVTLRPFAETDVPMLLDLSTDPYVPLIGTLPPHTDENGARAYIARQHERLVTGAGYSFCAAIEDTDEAIGQAGLWLSAIAQGRVTAGYVIAPAARGRGLARKALTALTAFAWTVPEVERIELYIEPWNEASTHTAQAAGYLHEGLLRSHQAIGGKRVDMHLYAAIRPARVGQPSASG